MTRALLPLVILLLAALPCTADDAFAARKAAYLESLPANAGGSWGAVVRLMKGAPIEARAFKRDLAKINARRDCADFDLSGFIRLLCLARDYGPLPSEAREAVEEAVLGFKYWIDEPGQDSMCYWSENHQILYHSSEYLAGVLFPDATFSNAGMTGRQHQEKALELLDRWLDWRETFGFSEWFSNVYWPMDLMALLNLVDFAPDPAIAARATMAVDQMLLSMTLNSFRGELMCTHGRSYQTGNRYAHNDRTGVVAHLVWGVRPLRPGDMSDAAIALATSRYQPPPALAALGQDAQAVFENYQNHGVPIADGPAHGLPHDSLDAIMAYWGMGMYVHPEVIDTTARAWRAYNALDNEFFTPLARAGSILSRLGLLAPLMRLVPTAASGAYLADAHTYCYRTPHYQLSSALDFRPGCMGAQVLTWQATLGGDAVVLTTHPARVYDGSPGHWHGNGALPRIAQHKNVAVIIYNAFFLPVLGEINRCDYTHAWFPKAAFDEVVERGRWVCARKGAGYVGLFSHVPPAWQLEGRDAGKELIAEGRENIWICELGSTADYPSLEAFACALADAQVAVFERLSVSYDSPSLGRVRFGWKGDFEVNGEPVPLRRPMRYDNPYIQAPRYAKRLVLRHGDDVLALDFDAVKRRIAKAPEHWDPAYPSPPDERPVFQDFAPDVAADKPERVSDDWPLSDQDNEAGWTKYEPLWDEFDGDALDAGAWWDHNPGWQGRQPAFFWTENVAVRDGALHLTMRKQEAPKMPKGYHTYTSAAVKSKEAVRYGYFECRAKPMKSHGSSAFWFYNATPAWWTEIDVFEIGGGAPAWKRSVNMNLHEFRTPASDAHWSVGGRFIAPFDLADDYHVYGVEWDAAHIKFYVDGCLVRSGPNTHWHQPLHLNFDSETMPNWFGLPKDEDLPSTFSVDYIRAWKRNPGHDR